MPRSASGTFATQGAPEADDVTIAGRFRLWSFRPPGWLTCACAGAVSLSYVVIVVHTPVVVFPSGAHDDGLYMSLGAFLAHGLWLGPFDQYTLMKGPGYPAFLAVSHWLGTSVSLAHALFHSAVVVLFVAALHRFIRVPALSALLFVLLLWHPISLTVSLLRVIRDAIYSGQILLFLALFVLASFWPLPARRRILYAVLSGAVLSWLWLTREEGVVLLPGLAVIAAAAGLRAARQRRFGRFAWTLAVVLAAFAVPQAGFRAVNWWWYGTFVGVDFHEGNYQRALGALHSVRSGEVRPFVSVTRPTRERIYAVSPAFASLGAFLDGPLESAWGAQGCNALPITCGEIASGWFMWALRDAAAMAGHYSSPARSSAFFGRLADEVSAACARGALECRPQPIAAMPPVTADEVARLPPRLHRMVDLLLFRQPSPTVGPSDPDPFRLAVGLRFLNHPLHVLARGAAHADAADLRPDPLYQRKRLGEWSRRARAWILGSYELVLVPVLVAGAATFLLSTALYWRMVTDNVCHVLALAAWVFVLTRALFLVVVDATSMPVLAFVGYVAPAHFLMVCAAVLSIAAWLQFVAHSPRWPFLGIRPQHRRS